MKDKTELRRRKAIRTSQIKKLLQDRGYKSPAAYKRYIDDVGRAPEKYPGKSLSSSATFRNLIDGKSIQADFVEEYADDLGVSTDYLLGRSPYFHVDNQVISELTGLSDASIEVLREIKRRADNPGWDDDLSAEASTFIACLNLILETTEAKVEQEVRPMPLQILDGDHKVKDVIHDYKTEVVDKEWPINSFLTYVMKYIGKEPRIVGHEDGQPLIFEDEDIGQMIPPMILYRTWLRDMVLKGLDELAGRKEGRDNGKH